MKCGTLVKLPDGRIGTVVYHGLDGYGIKWGEHIVTPAMLEEDAAENGPDNYTWGPEAMLRDPYEGAPKDMEYVGRDYERLEPSHD